MELEKLKRKTIRRLKEIKAEQGLSISQIMEMLEKAGQFVSEPTLKKIFAEGSEEKNFRYQDTIMPVADVLLDLYGDKSGLDDVESLRQIIREKNKFIEMILFKLEEQKEIQAREKEMCDERKAMYERSIERLEKQIERKDRIIEQFMNTYLPVKGE